MADFPFDNPLSSRTKTARTARRGRHAAKGNYLQITFRLPAEFKAVIEEVARDAGISQEDAKRWLVAMGIAAYRAGERPEVITQEANKLAPGELAIR